MLIMLENMLETTFSLYLFGRGQSALTVMAKKASSKWYSNSYNQLVICWLYINERSQLSLVRAIIVDSWIAFHQKLGFMLQICKKLERADGRRLRTGQVRGWYFWHRRNRLITSRCFTMWAPPATLCLLVYKPLYIKFLRTTINPTVIAFMFTNLAIERGPHIASMSDDLVIWVWVNTY